ncbi:ABC transporter permease [Verticiella sediminum]|uniref:ABC transporter permease n=1 Tax=Verticiella sediminum TaxID=1247510 RepID=A0A556AKI2_9BURK|nr:ABC transporter permease [Verticiella sediminum]TSH93398.1 ABC transporter permease [Verticiella sediminum]
MKPPALERPTAGTAVAAFAVALFILAPILIVVPMSFSSAQSFEFPPPGYWLGHYAAYFSEDWLGPTLNSFVIAVASSVVTLAVATPAAFAVNRREFATRRALQIVLLLPMLVPSIIMAISYYSVFGMLGLNQTYLGVILAHTCISIPVVLIAMSASLRNLDRNLERAALICGATPAQGFLLVTFPLLRPAFLIAAFFAFIHSFDEATISLFISSREVSTLPRRMFSSIHLEADPVIAVASTFMIAVALTVMVVMTASSRHRRRQEGAR